MREINDDNTQVYRELLRESVYRILFSDKEQCNDGLDGTQQRGWMVHMIGTDIVVKGIEFSHRSRSGAIVQPEPYPYQGLYLMPVDDAGLAKTRDKGRTYYDIKAENEGVDIVRCNVVGYWGTLQIGGDDHTGVSLRTKPVGFVDSCVEDSGRARIDWVAKSE